MYEYFRDRDRQYIIMEICTGGELLKQIQRGPFTENKARDYMLQILLVTNYIHSKGYVHRDLKPENILLDAQGHIRLADFGLAKQGKEGADVKAHSFCGSLLYLAPEMVKKEGITKSSDIYQIGIVLYEMLVGITPYHSEDISIL